MEPVIDAAIDWLQKKAAEEGFAVDYFEYARRTFHHR
jgi:hypothetical protein